MSHIEGSVGGIDLHDPQPSDYFKIGVAHGEQDYPLDPTYASISSYQDGWKFGAQMRPYLFPPTG